MAYIRNIFFILTIIKLSSGLCSHKKMKWCINSEYYALNGTIVEKESCKSRPCIISTCPTGKMNKYQSRKCIDMNGDFSEILTLYRLESGEPVKTDENFHEKFQVVTYKNGVIPENNCTHGFFTMNENFYGHFLNDGSFFLSKQQSIITSGEYIVKFVLTEENGLFKPRMRIVFAKNDVSESPFDKMIDVVLDYVMLISVFFMILVLIVYILCKELRTTAGLIFMSYVATWAITFTLLVVRQLLQKNEKVFACYPLSVLIHFFTISSYMWMNIMGFDIWYTLRNMFYQRRRHDNVNYRKYKWYCVVAWVPTLVYVIMEICFDEFAEFDGPEFEICTACSNQWYLEGPQLTMQIINFIPFILIIFNLVRIHNSNVKHLNSVDSNSTSSTQNAFLCLKISVMLGTNWFLDAIVSAFYEDLPNWFKYTVKSYNALIGVILFLIYVMKADVLLKLFRRLSIDNKITKDLERRVSRKYSNKRKHSQQNDSSSGTVLQVVN